MPSLAATIRPTSVETRLASKFLSLSLITSEISLVLIPTLLANSYEAARRRRNCCNRVATLASTSRSPYWSFNPPRMAGSTRTSRWISRPRRLESSSATRSRSFELSSTAVVTVARTRPAASSASRWNSSAMAPTSRTRSDSMRSFARLVASLPSNRSETMAMRCSVAMVGLVSARATSGSDNTALTWPRRRLHSPTWPSLSASSNTALAYRLAAAVATRHLLDGLVDQLAVLRVVERLADDLFRGGNHQVGDLAANRTHRLVPLGFDLFARSLDRALGLLFRFLPHLLPKLLRRF